MENLIYYPGFEITNVDWLKFALFYIDRLNPIIPESGNKYLSDLHYKLSCDTDLIHTHRPDYDEGIKSSLDAIDIVDKIFKRPRYYFSFFKSLNIIKSWQNPDNWKYTLFEEKFSGDWKRYCIDNKIGEKCDDGLLVSKDLGFIYMTVLAQTICDFREISPITDRDGLDKFSLLMQKADKSTKKKYKVAQSIINLKVPENISRLSIDQIIEFRNKPGYKERLNSFQSQLSEFLTNCENGKTEKEFINSFNGVWKEFTDEIVQFGIGSVGFGLGVWILVNSPNITTPAYLKEVVVGGSALTVGSIISIRNTWKNTQTKRYCRKYLSNLEKLKPQKTDSFRLKNLSKKEDHNDES